MVWCVDTDHECNPCWEEIAQSLYLICCIINSICVCVYIGEEVASRSLDCSLVNLDTDHQCETYLEDSHRFCS
jgi:hypothetical protein